MRISILFFFISSISLSYTQSAKNYFKLGNDKLDSNNFNDAIEYFNKALEIDSLYTDAYFNRGFAKLWIEDYKGSWHDNSKVIELDSNYLNAFLNRAEASRELGQYESALSDLNFVLLKGQIEASIFSSIGITKGKMNDFEGSIKQ